MNLVTVIYFGALFVAAVMLGQGIRSFFGG